jgi:hypothetical protein
LAALAKTSLAKDPVFGGATALSVLYLHHRRSDDIELFLGRMPSPADETAAARAIRSVGLEVESRALDLRRTLTVLQRGREIGHVDLAYYPYEPIGRRTTWQGLRVESLLDLTVDKLQALLTRARERDFVDIYFLLREGPERDLDRLLGYVRAKFEVGPAPATMAERFLAAESLTELSEMIRKVSKRQLASFFEELARKLVRRSLGTSR